MKKKIVTIATAHLDTSWLWTQETTIKEYIPETLRRNFEYFEKYPNYKFNFEGSYRYELAEEYYPEQYKKLADYIAAGRWNVCGSCYENGDVNVPSPEALIRNILYGNSYFREKFGKESNDIFLPDCFGFGKALPSVAAHCGLTGFSTQKLTWGSANGVPFDIGFWRGLDGRGLWTSIKPGSYNNAFTKIRTKNAGEKLKENEKYGCGITMLYHGTGDRGGAPAESSVKVTEAEIKKNAGSDIDVVSGSTKEFFDELEAMPEDVKKKMPVWDDEFLMTEHGAGSYTTRTLSKRWNKKSEVLADCAERSAVLARLVGAAEYPSAMLDFAWKKTIQHQFHDDITGTSFQVCYNRNWNDYMLAMNASSREYTNAVKSLCAVSDTSFAEGLPVAVSNTAQGAGDCSQSVSVILPECFSKYARVFDRSGEEVPSQTANGRLVFCACVPSNGLAFYDIRPSETPFDGESTLKITKNSLENEKYRIQLDGNLDICSVFDKKLGKELLASPIRLALLRDTHSIAWSAWEVKYKDLSKAPFAYPGKGSVKIIENGAARVSLETVRHCGKSVYKQIISLSRGSETADVFNEVDWREEAADLKVSFPFAASAEKALYDIGIGAFGRGTNTKKLFEVPAQRWADITDENKGFGVSVISDSRSGWDFPKNNELRLTAIHTPLVNHRWECSQHLADLGINRFSFAIYSHSGRPDYAPKAAESFVKPMHTFITDAHKGRYKKNLSLCTVSSDTVRILGIKKAQQSEKIILRVVETSGTEQKNIRIDFMKPVKSAELVRGDEIALSELEINGGRLCFDLEPNEIKSFALCFELPEVKPGSAQLELPFNAAGITSQSECAKGNLKGGVSIPSEIVPEALLTGGVRFTFKKEGENAVLCRSQKINSGKFPYVKLLAASFDGDREVLFGSEKIKVYDAFEPLAVWDMIGLKQTGFIKPVRQAASFTHTHTADGDEVARQINLFEITLKAENGEITLPDDESIAVFAAAGVKEEALCIPADEHSDTLRKRPFDYEISKYAKRMSEEPRVQQFLDKFLNRRQAGPLKILNNYMTQSLSDVYYIFTAAGNFIGKEAKTAKYFLSDMKSRRENK